jgi:hypothetical protein
MLETERIAMLKLDLVCELELTDGMDKLQKDEQGGFYLDLLIPHVGVYVIRVKLLDEEVNQIYPNGNLDHQKCQALASAIAKTRPLYQTTKYNHRSIRLSDF